MPSPHGRFIWYELMTDNADAAGRFYSAVVPGWNFGERVPVDIDYRMILRGDGGNAGGVMQLDQAMRDHGARPVWMGYVGADDVDATVERAQGLGGTVLMPPWDVPGVGRLAMIADPHGNALYLMAPEPPEGDPDTESDVFSGTEEQRVAWNELMTPDPADARRFYGELFGWTSEESMPMGDQGEYRFLELGGTTFGAVCPKMGSHDSKWRYYIRVPSIARAIEAVKAGGGSVSVGPHEVPGGDHIIIGQDPRGAEFALVGKA